MVRWTAVDQRQGRKGSCENVYENKPAGEKETIGTHK
jgi:hypothetical protein